MAEKSKSDQLLEAILAGDDETSNAIIASMSWGEVFVFRDQTLPQLEPAETRALARAYQANPAVVPGYMREPVNRALSGFPTTVTPPVPTASPRRTVTAAVSQPGPTPPQNVGRTPVERAPMVQEMQSGTRRQPVDNRLMNVLEFAAAAAGVNVVVFSGGQAAIGEAGPRTGSTRHDRGMAADVYLYQNGRELRATNADDRRVMQAFISASVAGGANGIGAGVGYMGSQGQGIHIGYGPGGNVNAPLTTWGPGGATQTSPDWLLAAVAPEATRSAVAALQTNLRALGYYSEDIDGLIGPATRAALASYSERGNPISLAAMPAGYGAFLGARTRPSPGLLERPGRLSPEFVRPARIVSEQPRVPIPRARPALFALQAEILGNDGRLRRGSTGAAVSELQSFLNERGARDARGRSLTVDGVFGRRTREALREYQASHPELLRDAVVGPRTLAAIMSDQRLAERATGSVAAFGIRDASETVGIAYDVARRAADRGVEREAAFATRDASDAAGVATAAEAAPETAAPASGVDRLIEQVPEQYRGVVREAATFGGALMAWLTSGGEARTGMSLDEFNRRFDPTTPPFEGSTGVGFTDARPGQPAGFGVAEFNRRFDPTAPDFEGSTGLNFTINGLPAPRGEGGFWGDVFHSITTGNWSGAPSGRYYGIGSDAAARSRVPGAAFPGQSSLELSNAFRPHDGGAISLGGSTRLGSGSEFDGVYGTIRGAAAYLNQQEQQEQMSGRFSDAFAPAAFTAALSLFPQEDGGALVQSGSGLRFSLAPNAYQQLTGRSLQDTINASGGSTYDGGGYWSSLPALTQNTGGAPVYQTTLAEGSYQELFGTPTPTYDPWQDYSWSYSQPASQSTGGTLSDTPDPYGYLF